MHKASSLFPPRRPAVVLPRLQALRFELGAAGLLLLLALLYFAPYLGTGKTMLPYDLLTNLQPWSALGKLKPQNLMMGDVLLINIPWHSLYRQALLSGEVPFWNPYNGGGAAFMANHMSAVFYPFSMFFLLPSVETAFLLFGIFHKFTTGFGMYCLLRQLRLSRPASLTGAAAWMFSGILTVWISWPAIIASLTWLPWAFLFVERILAGGRGRELVGLAVSVALIFLGGHVQFTYYSYLGVGFYTVFRVLTAGRPWSQRLRAGMQVVAGGGLGLLLSAAQILPSLELFRFTLRGAISIDRLMTMAIPGKHLLALFVPELFGNANIFYVPGNFVEYTGYMGVIGLGLAAAAALHPRLKKEPPVWFFAGLALLALHLAYGGVLNRLFAYLPGYTVYRALGRLYSLWSFAVAALAAVGLDALLLASGWRRTFLRLVALTAAVAAAGLLLGLNPRTLAKAGQYVPYVKKAGVTVIGSALWMALAAGLACLLALQFGGQAKGFRRLAWLAPLAVLFFDLLILARGYLPVVDASLGYPRTPAIDFLEAGRLEGRIARFRTGFLGSPLSQNIGILWGLEDLDVYDSFSYRPYVELVAAVEPRCYEDLLRFNQMYGFTEANTLANPILDLLRVSYLLAESPLPAADLATLQANGWEPAYSGPDMAIYRNWEALPLASLVSSYQVEPDPAGQLARVSRPDYAPAQEMILAQPPNLPVDPAAVGQARHVRRTLNTVEFDVEVQAAAGQAALLRIGQNNYPGWQATLDGRPAPLLTADYALQAIAIPAGRHQVRLAFRPTYWWLGLGLTVLAAAILAGVGLIPWVSARRNRPASRHPGSR